MWCAYTILIMAVYWICECLPLAITSLIPVVLLPLTGTIHAEHHVFLLLLLLVTCYCMVVFRSRNSLKIFLYDIYEG